MSNRFLMKTTEIELDGQPRKMYAGEQVTDQASMDALDALVPPVALTDATGGVYDDISNRVAEMRQRGANEVEIDAFVMAAILVNWY